MASYAPKKYLIETLGCQANVADSNTMTGILDSLGFEPATSFDETDLFIVNTCSVRQKSEDKAYGMGKKVLKRQREKGNKPFTIMSGCMVGSVTGDRQRYEFEELQKRTPWVDAYMNPSQLMDLPRVLKEGNMLSEWALQKFDPNNVIASQSDNRHAFVNISSGCDNFCTFCVVPYARGQETSRKKEHIIGEIKHLLKRDITTITLCGQNVNSWGLDMSEKFNIRTGSDQKLPFAQLLREVHELPNIEKIDFISSNPFDFTKDLIETLKLPKISDYLHIAVQSGNNDVLKRMNRRHTVEEFIALMDLIKEAKPTVELGTDVIVGFPGETREQFMDTVKLFEKIKFNVAYISIYSPRKGTPAEKFFKDDVSVEEKKWRHAYLTDIWVNNKPERIFISNETSNIQ
ncbi:MAG: MiaB/RimO family radical SAM methylthiotransferase [Patescibacteria group bacterium]